MKRIVVTMMTRVENLCMFSIKPCWHNMAIVIINALVGEKILRSLLHSNFIDTKINADANEITTNVVIQTKDSNGSMNAFLNPNCGCRNMIKVSKDHVENV